jgi:CheY-like chemotaxis protein
LVRIDMSKILVVDDQVDAADGLSMLFEAPEHDTRIACEGVQAISLALSTRRSLGPCA